MGEGSENGLSLKNPDPFQFRKEGLGGKVIGAQFAIIFLLLLGIAGATVKMFRVMEQFTATSLGTTQALKGFNATVYQLGESFETLASEVRAIPGAHVQPPPVKPKRPPPPDTDRGGD